MKKLLWGLSFIASSVLLTLSIKHTVSLQVSEVIAFITGGYCVWLAVVENIWNWPIGIVNAAAFLVLFISSKLYADAALQVVYIVLGFLGWYWWLKGGSHRTKLRVSRMGGREALILMVLGIIGTYVFWRLLGKIGDIAPFLDGLTTTSSLIAQYMLTKKYLQNWYVWIATDIVYIGLYGFKQLYLTAVLYAIFLAMCIVGVRDWRRTGRLIHEDVILKQQEA